ncbi:MAG: cyclodeaminase/cyclohydrolase family protein, partial [Chloroflexota bacterium]|nr:cyclodeaminase/cyclohydrolase family protein [Chloroflexota bacterium]
GSASALAGALGAALVEMVCELTLGKPEYEEVDTVARQIGAAAGELRGSLLAAAEEDATAYLAVVAARRLPRDGDEQRAARKAAIGEASVAATEVPLRVARLAAKVLDLAASIASIGNRNAVSDAGAAALLAAAAARGATLNVRINLPSLPDAHPLRAQAGGRLAELDSSVTKREAEALAAVSHRMSA